MEEIEEFRKKAVGPIGLAAYFSLVIYRQWYGDESICLANID